MSNFKKSYLHIQDLEIGKALVLSDYDTPMFKITRFERKGETDRNLIPLISVAGTSSPIPRDTIRFYSQSGYISAKNEIVLFLGRVSSEGSAAARARGIFSGTLIYCDVYWRGEIFRMSKKDLQKFTPLETST